MICSSDSLRVPNFILLRFWKKDLVRNIVDPEFMFNSFVPKESINKQMKNIHRN